MNPQDTYTATDLMKRWGYKDRTCFWEFVHAHGVPHVRLNARKIVFEAGALEDWLASRRVGARRGRRGPVVKPLRPGP